MSDNFDLSNLTNMLGGFTERLDKLKSEAANTEVTGEAGGGIVKVTATGNQVVTAVSISEEAMGDRELLEDLVRAATNEAMRRAQEASAGKLNELTAGLPLPPGLI